MSSRKTLRPQKSIKQKVHLLLWPILPLKTVINWDLPGVWWLRLRTSNAEGMGSIPGQESKISTGSKVKKKVTNLLPVYPEGAHVDPVTEVYSFLSDLCVHASRPCFPVSLCLSDQFSFWNGLMVFPWIDLPYFISSDPYGGTLGLFSLFS